MKLFFELIQVALGNKKQLERMPTPKEWVILFDMACKQSLASVLLEGVSKITENNPSQKPPINVLYEWIGIQQWTIMQNELQNQRTKELYELFKKAGFRGCILKGQGTALYYEKPEHRQCGDIDIWVTKEGGCEKDDVRREVLTLAQEMGCHVGHIDIKHSEIDFFEDVPVEVHFVPSWMYNPATNKKLQKFFDYQAERQFNNYDGGVGYTYTTIEFDLVFSLVHIYRHVFSEGIGLRQLMDYYHILVHSTYEQRKDAFVMLKSLKMTKFVGGVMWILRECFNIKTEYMLCPINERHGIYLLSEILIAGNFGQYDDRMLRIDKEKRFERGVIQLKRNIRFLCYYPSEVLWSPFWKLWHWGWRKRKGYL